MKNMLTATSPQPWVDYRPVMPRVSVWFSKAIPDQRCYRVVCQCGGHKLFLLPPRLQAVMAQLPQPERPFKDVNIQVVRSFFRARRRGQCVLDLILEEQQQENDSVLF